jgi:nucleotide-binding universal stress UspA family protein
MNTILAALDGSPRQALVLREATELARARGAKLILYRAVGLPPDIPHGLWKAGELDLATILLGNAEKSLAEVAKTLPAELVRSCAADLAVGWDGICQAAKRFDVDAVVIGSHGYGGFDRILGTTASRVVNHIDRSVFVIRPHPAVTEPSKP